MHWDGAWKVVVLVLVELLLVVVLILLEGAANDTIVMLLTVMFGVARASTDPADGIGAAARRVWAAFQQHVIRSGNSLSAAIDWGIQQGRRESV